MRLSATHFAGSIFRFTFRDLPTFATSQALLLVSLCVLLYVLSIGWALLVPLSLSSLPDVQGVFFVLYFLSLMMVGGWVLLPRHFSIIDRFGVRSGALEVFDYGMTLFGVSFVMLSPFVTTHLLSLRIAGIVDTPHLFEDINDYQRAINYPLFDQPGRNPASRIHYWGDASTMHAERSDGDRVTGIPGILPAFEAVSRAQGLIRSNDIHTIESDGGRLFEVVRRYSPEACRIEGDSDLTPSEFASDTMKLNQLSGDQSVPGVEFQREDLQGKYSCVDVSEVAFATGQVLISKGIYNQAPIYLDSLLMEYSLAVTVYSASLVFLLGTLTRRYLIVLAPSLAVLTVPLVVPRAIWFSPLVMLVVYVIVMGWFTFFTMVIIRRFAKSTVYMYAFATVAALPSVLFLAINTLAFYKTALGLISTGRDDAGLISAGVVRPIYESRFSFLNRLDERRPLIDTLAWVAIPYAATLGWLRNLLISLRSAPKER